MRISILSVREHLRSLTALQGSFDENRSFDSIRLLCADEADFSPDTLYVASPEELRRFLSVPGKARHGFLVLAPVSEEDRPAYGVTPDLLCADACLPAALLFNSLQDLFERCREWEARLDRAIYADRSVQGFLDAGSSMLGSPLLVWDSSFNILADTVREATDWPALQTVLERRCFDRETSFLLSRGYSPSGSGPEDPVRVFPGSGSPEPLFYIHSCYQGRQRTCSAALVSWAELSPGRFSLLRFFFEKFEEFVRVTAPAGSGDSLSEGFLRSLAGGALRDAGQIRSEAAANGLSPDESYLLYRITFADFSFDRVRFFIDSMHLGLPSEPIIVHDSQVLMLKSLHLHYCQAPASQQRFRNLLESYDAVCGLSREITDLAAFPAAFEQAGAALRFGLSERKLDARCSERLFYYGRIAALHLLACYEELAGDPLALLPGNLSGLLQNGGENASDLQVLAAYLENGLSSALTAKALGLHRNTVIYRLNRIRETYSLDLNDQNALFNVLLLMKLRRYRALTGAVGEADAL